MYIIKMFFIFTIFFNVSFAFDNIPKVSWLSFTNSSNCSYEDLQIFNKYIKKSFIESEFFFTKYDFNKDGTKDYFISSNSTKHCGSGGCSSFLLLSNNKSFSFITSPQNSFASVAEKTIGVTQKGNIVFSNFVYYWIRDFNNLKLIKKLKL